MEKSSLYVENTNDINNVFSAVIRSCKGWLPPRDGIVELCAILVAAVLNMMVVRGEFKPVQANYKPGRWPQ